MSHTNQINVDQLTRCVYNARMLNRLRSQIIMLTVSNLVQQLEQQLAILKSLNPDTPVSELTVDHGGYCDPTLINSFSFDVTQVIV